jgi:hypothetical protein
VNARSGRTQAISLSGSRRPWSNQQLVSSSARPTWHRKLSVGLLALGPEAWVSHESAATLLDLDRSLFEPLHFTVPRNVRTAIGFGTVYTTSHIGHLDVITVKGFRCSSATRTVLDLAHLGVPPQGRCGDRFRDALWTLGVPGSARMKGDGPSLR